MKNCQLLQCNRTGISYYLSNSCKNTDDVRYFFIHGFGSNSLIWEECIVNLNIDYWCSIDLIGHGKSNNLLLNDIFQLYDTLSKFIVTAFSPVKKITLFAHSLGAMLALKLLIDYDNIFTKAVLISTDSKIILHPKMIEFSVNNNFDEDFIRSGFPENTNAKCIQTVLDGFGQLNISHGNELDFLSLGRWHNDDIESLTVPCLLCTGEKDKILSPRRTRKLTERISTAKHINIKNTGHYPFLEQPVNFSKEIEYYLHD